MLVYSRNQAVNDFNLGRFGLGRDTLCPVFLDPPRHQRQGDREDDSEVSAFAILTCKKPFLLPARYLICRSKRVYCPGKLDFSHFQGKEPLIVDQWLH